MAAVSLAATVLSWRPYAWRAVRAGLDPSWEAGLAEGFVRHLQWGPSLVFSFGPYGFVDNLLPFYLVTASLGVLYAVVVSWGLAAMVVLAVRPSWGLLGGGVVAWGAIAIAGSRTGYSDLAAGTALGLALAALRCEGDRQQQVLVGLLGALAGLQLLVKVNDGLVALGLLVVVVLVGGRRLGREALVGGASLVAVVLVAWSAAGQHLGNLYSYARGSLAVATGYSSAMQLSTGRQAEDWYAVADLLLVGMALAWVVAGQPSRRAKVATVLAVAGWAWAQLKEGFVRHDTHDLTFFGLALVALALLDAGRRYRGRKLFALVVAASLACVAAGGPPPELHSPLASASGFADDVGEVAGLGGFGLARSDLRAQLLATGDAVPGRLLGLLVGHTVAVEPARAAVAYAYPQLDWDPEPVLQAYSAYTGYLDRLDASFLASARAPQRILYLPADVIDDQDPWDDPPATLTSMYCHYVQLVASGPYEVLSRVPDRCGRPVLVGRVETRLGEVVSVPSEPGDLVTASFAVPAPLVVELESLALKAPVMHMTVWGPRGAGSSAASQRGYRRRLVETTYRFVPGTAGDARALVVPPALGYGPGFTPPPVDRLELAGGGRDHEAVTVRFYAQSPRAQSSGAQSPRAQSPRAQSSG